jgi:hypothetical protein
MLICSGEHELSALMVSRDHVLLSPGKFWLLLTGIAPTREPSRKKDTGGRGRPGPTSTSCLQPRPLLPQEVIGTALEPVFGLKLLTALYERFPNLLLFKDSGGRGEEALGPVLEAIHARIAPEALEVLAHTAQVLAARPGREAKAEILGIARSGLGTASETMVWIGVFAAAPPAEPATCVEASVGMMTDCSFPNGTAVELGTARHAIIDVGRPPSFAGRRTHCRGRARVCGR